MRDERKTRLLVRFCAADKLFHRRLGIMGIALGYGSTAAQIVSGTSQVFTDFATSNRGTKRARLIEPLRRTCRVKCHHCTVDSASNELVATEVQRLPVVDILAPLTPNCLAAIRDSAHSCRRFLSRPWACDDVMNNCVLKFARGAGSPARIIQNSPDVQWKFKEYVKRFKPESKRLLKNLRAAKHRFETFQKPLARTIFLFLPIFALMCWIATSGVGHFKKNAMTRRLSPIDPQLDSTTL